MPNYKAKQIFDCHLSDYQVMRTTYLLQYQEVKEHFLYNPSKIHFPGDTEWEIIFEFNRNIFIIFHYQVRTRSYLMHYVEKYVFNMEEHDPILFRAVLLISCLRI